jgi:hypothetical protein
VLRAILLLCLSVPLVHAAVPLNCAAGLPLGDLRLKVQSDPKLNALPLRGINRLGEGDVILYEPVKLRINPKGGKVALVVAPAPVKPGDPIPKELPKLEVLAAIDADKPGKWDVPFRVGVAALVYGPEGLSIKRVKEYLGKEDDLISQLADYAEKTAQTEQLLAAVNAGAPLNGTQVDAALNGLGTQAGITGIDRTLPRDQQLSIMLRTVNPALAGVDPVAPDLTVRMQATASVATAVAGLFFGSPVGLAASGTMLAMNLRTMMFPGTEFRSSFAQLSNPKADDLDLCGKREPPRPRTKIAYLWAARIPNAKAPEVKIGAADHLPQDLAGPVNAVMEGPGWPLIDRAHDWKLVDPETKKEFPVDVHSVAAQQALQVDLSRSKPGPGVYELKATWDWNPMAVTGSVFVTPVDGLEKARVSPTSQDRIMEEKGRTVVEAEGADFEFVEKVAVQKTKDPFHPPAAVPFSLPLGAGRGPQDKLAFEIDTKPMEAGNYTVFVTEAGGKTRELPMKVLPPGPRIENAPLDISAGDEWQPMTLKGSNLGLLAKLESKGAVFQLGALKGDEREVRVKASPEAREGEVQDLLAFAQDVSKPAVVAGGVHVTGPVPRVVSSQISLPPQNNIPLKEGELPAGTFVSASLGVQNAGNETRVHLKCAKSSGQQLTLRVGEQTPQGSVQVLGSDSLFLSFDPGMWHAGCEIDAVLDNGGGASKAFSLGRVIRVPHVDTFELTEEKVGDNYLGKLTGTDLEAIAQVGWSADKGVPVAGLPAPLGGDSRKQSLQIALPWPAPSPHAPLYVWFRGETDGRATKIRY